MLLAAHRMRSRSDFAITRTGRKAATSTLVLHLDAHGDTAPRVGLIVSRSVGGSVARHRVSRRLRGVVAPRIGRLPAGSRLVVRALPASAAASSAALAADLDSALTRLGVPA